jgi:hypothetical protein
VLTRCAGQLRLAPGGAAVLGLDLTAALSLGAALGHDMMALAELLPAGEAGLVTALNTRLQKTQD